MTFRWTATYEHNGQTHTWTWDGSDFDDALAAFDADANTPSDVQVTMTGAEVDD